VVGAAMLAQSTDTSVGSGNIAQQLVDDSALGALPTVSCSSAMT